MFDVLIIGGGPAGVSAALYTLRANLSTAIIANGKGALAKAERIENYYGQPEVLSGEALFDIGTAQARRLGAEMITGEVMGIDCGKTFAISAKVGESATEYEARSVIIATGAKRKTLPIEGLERFEGSGVSYCAVCDAFFYRGKEVFVLGAGDYARHEAAVLENLCSAVTILTNGENPVEFPANYRIITAPIAKITGDTRAQCVVFSDGAGMESLPITGLFVAVGTAGAADLARKAGIAVKDNHIIVDAQMKTSVKGIFCAGDCTGAPYQIAVAAGEGAKAGLSVIRYLKNEK
jgi:thioredoxin reductase (NADPH)